MRYYFCVNCGYHGDFSFDRKRNIKCESCDYEDVTELSKEEYEETEDSHKITLQEFKDSWRVLKDGK